ncbi:MAG TPA: metallophosphoesterase family protein [Chitinophagales bacterium]|nr:metallophosphoesterase family protein [Chitinophagales bacterium]
MLKIALLSDTHGHLDETIFKYFDDRDEIWHAGDFGTLEVVERLASCKPLKGVYGNIDGAAIRAKFPEDVWMEIEGMKIFITHIAGSPGKYTPRVRKLLPEKKPALLICGHSHILKVMRDKVYNMMYMNPGAAGNEGFHKMKTLLRFSIDNGHLHDLEVIELGSRGMLL